MTPLGIVVSYDALGERVRTLLKILLIAPLAVLLAGGLWLAWELFAPFGPKERLRILAVLPLSTEATPAAWREGPDTVAYRLTLAGEDLEPLLDGGRHITFNAHRCGETETRMVQVDAYLEDVPIGGGGRLYFEKPRTEPFHIVLVVPVAVARDEHFRCGDFQYEEHLKPGPLTLNGVLTISNEVRLPPPLTPAAEDVAP